MKRGAESGDHWFYVATSASKALAEQGHVKRDKVQRRMDLMLCWWRHRNNAQFVQHDGGRMLEVIHECGEMDLTCEEGRLDELRSYWLLAFICAHDPWLWDVRDHWEYALLKWRVNHFYCYEHHFSTALLRNQDMVAVMGAKLTNQVDPVVKDSYTRRFPGSVFPTQWTVVPFLNMPPSMLGNPNWDVRDGGVHITYRDFTPWAWYQMVRATDDMNRRIHVARWDDVLGSDRLQWDQDMRDFLTPFLGQCQQLRDQEREAIRLAQAHYVDATLPSVSTSEEMLQAVKHRFPLCMMQHFWAAFSQGRHPKHESRVALAMFLVEAGYNVQQINGIMYTLFTLDSEFTGRYGVNGWNDPVYHKKFGVQVLDIYRKGKASTTGRAYGCNSLIRAGINGEVRGCPFFKKSPGARKDLVVMLDWAGLPAADIEDIAGTATGDPQRCQCDFEKRSALKDNPFFNPLHPNSYMRGYNKYTGAVKPVGEL
jgi:hypothetical protein